MPSEAAKRRAAQKKAQKQASSRAAQKKTVSSATPVTDEEEVKSKLANGGASPAVAVGNGLRSGLADMKITTHRSCTGNNYGDLVSITIAASCFLF